MPEMADPTKVDQCLKSINLKAKGFAFFFGCIIKSKQQLPLLPSRGLVGKRFSLHVVFQQLDSVE